MRLWGELLSKQTIGDLWCCFFLLTLKQIKELPYKVTEFDFILKKVANERSNPKKEHLRRVANLLHLHFDLVEQL